MSDHVLRRVVTGINADGAHVVTSDGPPPNSIDVGPIGVSEVFWSSTGDRHIADDPDRVGDGFPLEPPPGGASGRIIRMAGIPDGVDPDDTWLRVDVEDPLVPGMHATDTLDLMVVLEGSVILDLDDGDHTVGPGEFVIQRGTRHRWRPADEKGWTYFVTMLRPDPGAAHSDVELAPHVPSAGRVRRIVTGTPTVVGEPAVTFEGGSVARLTAIWQTGGPLRAVDQGGESNEGWMLEPLGGGIGFNLVELHPGSDIGEAGWHVTSTIDIDVILVGHMRLELPGGISTDLEPGDVVIQRGTDHRWVALGDETVRMASVMFAART
jgi:quercetin dioxygenase-like cupin family protein